MDPSHRGRVLDSTRQTGSGFKLASLASMEANHGAFLFINLMTLKIRWTLLDVIIVALYCRVIKTPFYSLELYASAAVKNGYN